jgi:hypothetical protein
MTTPVWELRFKDGRGASFFTNVDVTGDLGQPGVRRTIPVAASVRQGSPIADARSQLQAGEVLSLVADMSAIAFALRHSD